MISRSFLASGLLLMTLVGSVTPASGIEQATPYPDSLVLKDGRTVTGLILKNSVDAILIQEATAENLYPKSEIVRIQDEPDTSMTYTEVSRPGELPPWRVIANDLRTNDAIKRLEEIPAIRIKEGRFKNIPYKSFRVNTNIELNIYGDLENPAGLELGIFGFRSGNDELRKVLRGYLAGFLGSRQEIAALYALDLDGDMTETDKITFETTPKDAPDAQGAWWISLSNSKKLARARISDARYAALTLPEHEVVDKRGNLITRTWDNANDTVTESLNELSETAGSVLRGFYRTRDGALRLLTGNTLESTTETEPGANPQKPENE